MYLESAFPLKTASESTGPRLWDLNEANQPANESDFLQFLHFLEDHPQWVHDHEEEAKRCFTHLTKTDLSSGTEASGIARKIEAFLFRSYPRLFPSITLRLGAEEIRISKIPLLEKSEKFRTMFSRWNDGVKSEIVLETPIGIKPQVLKCFLHFLSYGEVQCTNENVPHLLRLAQEHFIPELTAVCNEYLEGGMRSCPLAEMLQLAVRYKIVDLKWHCLIFAWKNSEDDKFKTFFQQLHDSLADAPIDDKKELEEAFFILDSGVKCKNMGITPCLMGVRKTRTVWLDQPLYLEPFFITLFEAFAIDGLKITGDFATDQDLAQLEQLLPMPHFLLFRSSKIENIPKKWLAQVKEIDCSNCMKLSVLKAPIASQIAIRDCQSMIELYAPEAIKIDCSRSSLMILNAPLAEVIYSNTCSIQSLYAPVARRIISHDCIRLRHVYAPMAEEINCYSCRALEKLEAQRVKRIYLSRTLLINLDVPFAQHVICTDNNLLRMLNAPQVTDLTCQNNRELHRVDAPIADKIILSGCLKLSRVFAPMVKKIDCSGQPITFLEAEMAEEIDCSKTQLTHLRALRAKKINCSQTPLTVLEASVVEELDCSDTQLKHLKIMRAKTIKCRRTPLTVLEAPMAEYIDCSWTELTILDVPKGKTVKSRSCRSLEKLNAPMASLIDCCICDSLINLVAQSAEEIFMLDCSALKWLTAPLAKRISGSRCSLLEGIDARLANWINCPDCINLKHLNAPLIKEGNFYGCLSLAIPGLPENNENIAFEPNSLWKIVKDSFARRRK